MARSLCATCIIFLTGTKISQLYHRGILIWATLNIIRILHFFKIYSATIQSHTRESVVRATMQVKSMEKPKIWPPPPSRNPVCGSDKNWQRWLRCGPLHLCKSSSQSAQGFRFRACVTTRQIAHQKVLVLGVGGSCNSLQPRHLGGFWRIIRQNSRFWQGCAFSGSRT